MMLFTKSIGLGLSFVLLALFAGGGRYLSGGPQAGDRPGRQEAGGAEIRPDAELLAHWKFDDSFQDSSRRANHGLPVGHPGFADGKAGRALQLSGRDACVAIPKLAAGITRFTLAAWIYVREMPKGNEFSAIIHNNGWESADVHLGFHGEEGILDLGISGNEPDMSIPSFRVKDFQGRWVHLAVTYDADERNEVRFFVDGRKTDDFKIEEAHPVNLGPGRIGAWDESGRWFNGLIDEVFVYERTLTGDEIQTLFESGKLQ